MPSCKKEDDYFTFYGKIVIEPNSSLLISGVSGYHWRFAAPCERALLTLVQKHSLPVVLAQILVNRHIDSDQVASFLTPRLNHYLPDPSVLKDLDKGVAYIIEAIQQNIPIAILGDYDVDGATSTALLYRFFTDIKASPPLVYIPDRLKEGYGPSRKAIDILIKQNIKILITVDCGTTAFAALSYAKDCGLTVIIIDHHSAETALPTVEACINPNRTDETSSLTYLAAVGLCFLFVVALNRALRINHWYNAQRPEPNILYYLDLVALGTVCDVVPLIGLNRAYVSQGLKILGKRQNLGLSCLTDVANIHQAPTPYHLGYLLGPRINAGSRMAESTNGFELLTTQDPVKAQFLAAYLNDLNIQRRQAEQIAFEEALVQAQSQTANSVIVAWSENWSIGIIGIIAGRLKEIFKKPCFVISFEQTLGKGSARSIANVDIGSVIHKAKHAGLLQDGGGHAMAGGFSINLENIAAFCLFLADHLTQAVQNNPPFLLIEGLLNVGALTPAFVQSLEALGPFGSGNPQPRFMLKNMRIAKVDILKQHHLRCLLVNEDQKYIQAMAFQCTDTPLGHHLLNSNGRLMHVVGTLNINTWNNKESISFILQDLSYF